MNEPNRQPARLSATGGDRATAYVMSGKMVRRGGLLLCATPVQGYADGLRGPIPCRKAGYCLTLR